MLKIEPIYFQVAKEGCCHWGDYGEVLDAKMVTPEGNKEPRMCYYVRYLKTQDYDFVPVSEFGTGYDVNYWVCSYEQTQS